VSPIGPPRTSPVENRVRNFPDERHAEFKKAVSNSIAHRAHYKFEPIRTAEKVSQTVSYATVVIMLILILSPVLVPAIITGFHAIAERRARA
jgi:hypothetical protein